MNYSKSIFKAFDIRGKYPTDLNETAACDIAQAFLKMSAKRNKKEIKDLKIAVGRDIRESSVPLLEALIETFLEHGVTVDNLELISINDIYFVVGKYKYDGGVVVTASHNPPEYGGFKMVILNEENKEKVDILSGKEILNMIEKLDLPLKDEKFRGVINKKDFKKEFLGHVFSFVDVNNIKPFKIVVDTGNGMIGMYLDELSQRLPGEIITINKEFDNTFSKRPPNPLDPGAEEMIKEKILEVKANFGIMFDVDGDRIFFIDETGQKIRGDMLLLLMAKPILEKNPGAGIAYNLVCSHAVSELIVKWGGKPIRSEVGYINLARHMNEENGIMSGEVSGHFAFRDNYYTDSSLIAMLLVLENLSKDNRKLSKIISEYSLYTRGDEINLEVNDSAEKMGKVREYYKENILDEIDGITVEFKDWWFNIRPSGTEPLLRILVEAQSPEELKKRQQEVLEVIQ